MTVILGIDPGLTGALAWLRDDGVLLEVRDMPALDGEVSATMLAHDEEITRNRVTLAILEWPGLMPTKNNSAKTLRSIGMTLGTISAVLAVRGIPCHRVTPAHWKNQLGLHSDKGESRALAMRLWPDHGDRFARVKDDGRAEAALLAWWWLSKKMGQVA